MNDQPNANSPPPRVDASQAQSNAAKPTESAPTSDHAHTAHTTAGGEGNIPARGQDQPPDKQEMDLPLRAPGIDLPDVNLESIEELPDDHRVGYKQTPKKTRFKPGQSGNPSGKPKRMEASLGNKLEAHRRDLLDELVRLLALDISDLQMQRDDSNITLFAKNILSDALKKDGTYRKFIMEELLGKALRDERTRPVDPAIADAEMLQSMLRAAIDPSLSDKEADQAMERAVARRETTEEYLARRKKSRKRAKPAPKH